LVPASPLALYPWSRSVKTGVWLRALGNRGQCRPMGCKAREGLYVFLRNCKKEGKGKEGDPPNSHFWLCHWC